MFAQMVVRAGMPPTTPGFQRVRRSRGSAVYSGVAACAGIIFHRSATASETAATTRTPDFDKFTFGPFPRCTDPQPLTQGDRATKTAIQAATSAQLLKPAISEPLPHRGRRSKKQRQRMRLPAG